MRDINTIIHYNLVQRNISKVFELNLSRNPLRCSCSCLEFYLWMRNVRNYITFVALTSHHWTFDNGQKANLSNLNRIVDILRSQCARPDWSPVVSNCNCSHVHVHSGSHSIIQIETYFEVHLVETQNASTISGKTHPESKVSF